MVFVGWNVNSYSHYGKFFNEGASKKQKTELPHCESTALNMPANLENSAVATGMEKMSFHSNPKERQCQERSNYHAIGFISHPSKEMLKILEARPQ